MILVAIGLDQVALGLGLILMFSLGLAAMLIAVGVLVVRCHSKPVDRLGKSLGAPGCRLLPLISAVVVVLLGVGIILKGLTAYPA